MKIYIFFLSLSVSYFFNYLSKYIGVKLKILDIPDNKRKIHKKNIPRVGGISIFLSFSLVYFLFIRFFSFHYVYLILLLIFFIGFFEDKFYIRYRYRLILLTLIFSIVPILKLQIYDIGILKLPNLLSFFFTIFCLVGITNAFNFADGLNGLSSGLSIISLFFLFLTCNFYNDIKLASFISIGIGSIVGFFIRNFLRGDIFMGDSGSYFVGGFVGLTSITLLNRNPQVSPWAILLFVFIPVFDTLFSIYRRIRVKRSPFKPDKLHLHHRLFERYKKNQKETVLKILIIQILISLVSFIFHTNLPFLIVFTFISGYFLRYLWFRRIYIKVGNLKFSL